MSCTILFQCGGTIWMPKTPVWSKLMFPMLSSVIFAKNPKIHGIYLQLNLSNNCSMNPFTVNQLWVLHDQKTFSIFSPSNHIKRICEYLKNHIKICSILIQYSLTALQTNADYILQKVLICINLNINTFCDIHLHNRDLPSINRTNQTVPVWAHLLSTNCGSFMNIFFQSFHPQKISRGSLNIHRIITKFVPL